MIAHRLLRWLPCLWLSTAHAHPVAATLGEAHWRGTVLEVTLQVATHDLVAELARRKIDFFAPGVEAALSRYVSDFFVVSTPSGPAPIRWVGYEDGPTEVSLFFEVPLKTLAATTLTHRLGFQLSPTWLNTLNLHDDTHTWTLVFSAETPTRPLLSRVGNTPPAGPGKGP